jgi:NADH-quinone oxidoreductase subunit J
MEILHFFLCSLLIFSGLWVSVSLNPIESVLFLILAFCNTAVILFIFNVEFLGLLFIIIYVGAVAVLFLFIIMMLNIKNQESLVLNTSYLKSIYDKLKFFIFSFFVIVLFLFLQNSFQQDAFLFFDKNYDFVSIFDKLNNIDVIGQVLYNYFIVCFLLAGLVLLIALVGAIVLTLRFNSSKKSQLVSRQLSRTDNFLTFFK